MEQHCSFAAMIFSTIVLMQDLTTLFWPRKTRRPGHATICVRVTLDGQRICNLATGITAQVKDWNQKTQQMAKGAAGADQFNSYLAGLRAVIKSTQLQLNANGEHMTAAHVLEILRPGQVAKVPTLAQCFADYAAANQQCSKRSNTVRSIASRITIATTVATSCRLHARPVDQITARDGKTFLAALQQLGRQAETTRRILATAKDVLSAAVLAGHIESNPWHEVKVLEREKPKEVESLTTQQVNRLRTLDLLPEQSIICDLFLAMVATGMAYTDLHQMAMHNVNQVQGVQVLIYRRQKTSTRAYVPVTDEVRSYLQRWPAGPQLPTNQHFNRTLKEIGQQLALGFNLTTHHGRKTCATLLRQSGMPADTIALILGHTDTRITNRHYISRGPELLVAALASKM